jgi:hypothetical protein
MFSKFLNKLSFLYHHRFFKKNDLTSLRIAIVNYVDQLKNKIFINKNHNKYQNNEKILVKCY